MLNNAPTGISGSVLMEVLLDITDTNSTNVTNNVYGNIGVVVEYDNTSRVIIFPQLIVIHYNDLNKTEYYAYNGRTEKYFDIESYSECYDKVTEETGKELERIFTRTSQSRKK